jgi:hypothetical protein
MLSAEDAGSCVQEIPARIQPITVIKTPRARISLFKRIRFRYNTRMATILLIIIYLAFIIWDCRIPCSARPAGPRTRSLARRSPTGTGFYLYNGRTVISSLVSVRVIRKFGTGAVTAFLRAVDRERADGHFVRQQVHRALPMAIPLGLGGVRSTVR